MKYGRIAFITTPTFRRESPAKLREFVFEHMYSLCKSFTVMTTGGTFNELEKLVKEPLSAGQRHEQDSRFVVGDESSLERWRQVVCDGLEPTMPDFRGMIHIAYELVEQRLDAVIHLMDWRDKSAKPDSAVLSREANVHNVPIATDINTATAYVHSWNAFLTQRKSDASLFCRREESENPPIHGLKDGDRVLAMVAHDNMKLEICRFAVQHATHIFSNYDYVLATGTTGGWIKRFMEASNRAREEVKKIRLCNSGPKGGDIQIAYAVVKGWCHKIIFMQDPSVSHPHDSDIRLFEQAVASEEVRVELATNVESARFLIGP